MLELVSFRSMLYHDDPLPFPEMLVWFDPLPLPDLVSLKKEDDDDPLEDPFPPLPDLQNFRPFPLLPFPLLLELLLLPLPLLLLDFLAFLDFFFFLRTAQKQVEPRTSWLAKPSDITHEFVAKSKKK